MIRILQVISTLNVGSGIAHFVMNYYRKMVSDEIQFDFLLFEDVPNSFKEEVQSLGGNIYYISAPKLFKIHTYKKRVHEFFMKNKQVYDVVHIHEILVQKYICEYAKKYHDCRIFIHSHNSKFVTFDHGQSFFKASLQYVFKKLRNVFLLAHIKKNADYYLACSKEAGIALYGKKIVEKNDHFYLIKNSIDLDRYAFNTNIREEYRKKFSIADNQIVLMNVGRLCEQKNQVFLLDVFQKIIEKNKQYCLFLVGEGQHRKLLEHRIHESGLENNVKILGNRLDIPQLLQMADLYVFPSTFEGLGISLIEAQANGLTCISSNHVPQEACVSDQVSFIELNQQCWVDSILTAQLERKDTRQMIKECGYDLNDAVVQLKMLYLRRQI